MNQPKHHDETYQKRNNRMTCDKNWLSREPMLHSSNPNPFLAKYCLHRGTVTVLSYAVRAQKLSTEINDYLNMY